MRRLLITGSGGAGIFPLWNILKKKYKIYFSDFNTSLIHPKIPNKLKIKISLAKNKKFLFELDKIIQKYRIDLVVPTVDEEIIKICSNKSISSMSFIPNKQFIKRTMDKYILIQELKKFNLQFPKTYLSNSKKITFPKKYIIKPRFGRGSENIHVITKKHQIKDYLRLYSFQPKDVIVQEFIPGVEYTIFVGMDREENLVKILPFQIYKKKGITISGQTQNKVNVINFVKIFCMYFKTNNAFNIQLIVSKKGIYPIEVNPRISTTFFITLLDNYDPFKTKKKIKKKLEIAKKKFILNRHWENIIT
jgi:carbamoyl-phosphate synthase large subunit